MFVCCFLTVSLGSVFKAESERDIGIVLEELCGECIPPQVVAVLRPLLQPLVHLVDAVVGLRNWHRVPAGKTETRQRKRRMQKGYYSFLSSDLLTRLSQIFLCRLNYLGSILSINGGP